MNTFSFKESAPDELLSLLQEKGPQVSAKKRVAAFERLLSGRGAALIKKTTLTIPEQTRETISITSTDAPVTIFEIHQKPYSQLHLSYMPTAQKTGEKSMVIIHLIVEEGAEAEIFSALVGEAFNSLVINTELIGAGSSLREKTIFFGDKKQTFDIFSSCVMKGRNTFARIEAKGILNDSATARFDGSIAIEQTACKADASLTEHTLLLSPDASMNAVPGLTIGTNDVKASHSSGVTRVDDNQIFFAASRGISEKKAVELIAQGFLETLYSQRSEARELRSLIKKKLV